MRASGCGETTFLSGKRSYGCGWRCGCGYDEEVKVVLVLAGCSYTEVYDKFTSLQTEVLSS